MLEIRGIWLCHMSRWDRYVLRPRVRAETSESETVPHIGPYKVAQHSWQAVCAYHSSVRFCEKNCKGRSFTTSTPTTTPEQRTTSAAEPVPVERRRLHDFHQRVHRQGQSESSSSSSQC